jgi:hypothetical protein
MPAIHAPMTITDMEECLRGCPGDSEFLVELPDGTLAPVLSVESKSSNQSGCLRRVGKSHVVMLRLVPAATKLLRAPGLG